MEQPCKNCSKEQRDKCKKDRNEVCESFLAWREILISCMLYGFKPMNGIFSIREISVEPAGNKINIYVIKDDAFKDIDIELKVIEEDKDE